MGSNFYFLKERFSEYYKLAREAEKCVMTQPRTSVIYARLTVEELIKWMYRFDPKLSQVRLEKNTLEAMMYYPEFKSLIADASHLLDGLTLIRKSGNQAVHSKRDVSMRYAHSSISNLYEFAKWMYYTYVDSSEKLPFSLDSAWIPRGDGTAESKASLEALQTDMEKIKAEAEKRLHLKEVELEQLRQEIAAVKAANSVKQPEAFVMNPTTEAETRRMLIDVQLREMGWDIDQPDVQEFEVTDMPNTTGVGYVDYVLWDDNGLPLAVVEAKNTLHDARKGQHQAKLYADCLEARYGRRPLIFYTNGYTTWLWDDQLYPPRRVSGVYTKDEMQWAIQRRARRPLEEYKINKHIAGRPYQERAIKRTAETFQDAHRKALLVMATGTGKTRTAIEIVNMLLTQGWSRRILFLADRTALVKQAKSNFVKQLPTLSCINIVTEKADENINLYKMVFSTYPTIMNKIDTEKKDGVPIYSPGHFDVIIIDEAHRSVYQKYQAIFNYFDAMLIGLTATPKSEVDKNTYELFDLENHNPTDFYELDQAVKDGWLVPPKRISVTTKFMQEGIKYKELTEEDKARFEDDFAFFEEEEMPEEIESTQLNKFVFNADTVDKVLNQLMTDGIKIEGGTKIGKAIIFAKNRRHAEYIKERFDILYPHLKGGFMEVIHNAVDYAQDLIDNFGESNKMPQIAVSVDMLDTGIDVPEILNLVFFKVVRSSAKFWQMIGRGTRLRPELFGIAEMDGDKSKDKKEFLIFDYCGNFEFFDVNPDGFDSQVPKSVPQRILECQIALAQALSDEAATNEQIREFRISLLDAAHQTVLALNRNSFVVKAVLETVNAFSDRSRWDHLTFADTAELFDKLTVLAESSEEDENARNFDLMMLRLMVAITDGCESGNRYINAVKVIGKSLLKMTNLPVVKRKEETLKLMVSDHFWGQELSVLSLEKVRQDIRELIKLIEKSKRRVVYTNLEDEVTGQTQIVEVLSTYTASENYKQRVENYVRQHEDYLVIQKLKRNIPITHDEVTILENLLFDGKECGTKEDYLKEYGDKPLGTFIRTIVGLDRNAADAAFAQFLGVGNLTANQNQFISMIIDFLTTEGVVDVGMLYESPFTRFHHEGISGLFDDDKAEEIVAIIRDINGNAVA